MAVAALAGQPPAFSWTHVGQWRVGWPTCVALLVALAAYLLGAARVPPWPRARTACFVGAIVVVVLATQSVVGVYDTVLLSDHMIQHLLLIMVAAPLLAGAAPLDLASLALRGRAKGVVDGFIDGPVGRVVLHPAFGLAAYAVFIPAAHLSGLMNLALAHPWLHSLEELAFVVVGYLFFRNVFGLERGPRPLHPGLRLLYLMVAVPVDTFTGLALAMSSHNPFPALAQAHRDWGMSVLSDVHLAGAIMWIGGDALMLLALIPTAVVWVRYEDTRTKELDAELDRLREASA